MHDAVSDWRRCPLRAPVARLVEFAEKVTRGAADCAPADVEALRRLGWSDAALHDATQVVAYFNYINRIADALGVDPEPDLPRWGRA